MVVTSLLVDFKGNMRESERRLAKAYKTQVDWMALELLEDPAAIALAASSLLEMEAFAASTEYDALNRPISMNDHAGCERDPAELQRSGPLG